MAIFTTFEREKKIKLRFESIDARTPRLKARFYKLIHLLKSLAEKSRDNSYNDG